MKTTYQFKAGAHLSGDAQAVGERLEQLRARPTGLTADAVLKDAKNTRSVLHTYFEWDDSKAAAKYRLEQAGHLIRCVTVQVDDVHQNHPQQALAIAQVEAAPASFRAFMPVQKANGDRVYESTATALSDIEYRRQVLAQAHGELSAVGRKYRELRELAEVVSAIERVGELLSSERLAEQG